MIYKSRPRQLLILLLIAGLLFIRGSGLLSAYEPAQTDLQDVWQHVHQSGAYQYNAEVIQTNTPRPSVTNAGRESKSTTLYLEGETNLDTEVLQLRLWSEGGSVLLPESALEIKVDDQMAQARKGNGAWEEIEDFTGLFAPGGDFMAYTRAAENVITHPPEVRSTLLGDIEVIRYTFDINGYKFATQMRSRMTEQANREGLPPGVRLELPRMYKEMSGTGELWVGSDGLPLHQQFTLNFPPNQHGDATTADIIVNFSDFAPLPAASTIQTSLADLINSSWLLTLPLHALLLFFAFILFARSHSKLVYRLTAATIILSMLLGPLLSSQLVHAYGSRQQEQQQKQENKRAELDAQQEAQRALQQPTIDPHTDPLEAARRQKSISPAIPEINDEGRYFDESCITDPHGDMDEDNLTNLEECLLGTLPQVADTDDDGAEDGVEVLGFEMPNSQGQMVTWYTDPLEIDTNRDGIADGKEWYYDATEDGLPDDTDGDGTPDMWDEDNDGDGVPDDLDLSAYANTKDGIIFNEHNPFELVVNDLQAGKLINVEFQLSPTNPDHLWYTKNVLDWPRQDRQGQIQDVDGATFLDVNPDLTPIPNEFGDMRMVPLLQIDIPAGQANLPEQDVLDQFGISTHQTDENTQTAYVPLELVTESQGDAHTGFYGRMVYRANNQWGAAHRVRLIWAVQVLNDVCGYPEDPPDGYPTNAAWPPDPDQPPPGWSGDWPGKYSLFQDGLCQFYAAYNDLQIIQTYDDEWFLAGLMLTENHSADMALIYEDPAATANAEAGYDAPFYMDTLYGLLYGLDHTFLAASDCEPTDADDECGGDGQRDVTVDEIVRRFDHASNSGVSAEQRWNLPNVLTVRENSYESFDLGLMDTVVTQTVDLLDQAFTSAWSASEPITPTIMLAVEQNHRALNLDQTNGGSPLFNWNGRGLTLDLPQSGSNEVEVETIASLKWSPYRYDPVDGWTEANMASFWNDMTENLGDSFEDLSDPEEAETYHTMTQLMYMAVFGGINNVVQIGDKLMEAKYALPDAPIAFGLGSGIGKVLITGMKLYVRYSKALALAAQQARFALEFRPLVNNVPKQLVLAKFWQQQVSFYRSGLVAAAVFMLIVVTIVVLATALIFNYVVQDTNVPWNVIAAVSAGVLLAIITVINPIITTVRIAKTAAAIGGAITSFSRELSNTLAASSKTIGASKALSVFGLILTIGVAIGVFIWALTSDNGVTPGDNPAFYTLLATTIASIIVAILLFVLSLTVVGAILVGIIVLVDTILLLLGVDFSITGFFTDVLATIIYRYNISIPSVDTGALGAELSDPDQGYVAGSEIRYSLPITTTFGPTFFISENMRKASFVYRLDKQQQNISTSIGAREDEWIVAYVDPDDFTKGVTAVLSDDVIYSDQLQPGINVAPNLTLSYAYALRGRECWLLFICNNRDVSDNDSDNIGRTYVFDVLPASLEDFVTVNRWGFGTGGPASFLDPDGDGLLDPSQGGLDPNNSDWDSDNDGLSDGYELEIRSIPASEGGVNLNPEAGDSDNDGVPDAVELRWGTDPGHPDSDGDGLTDQQEISGWLFPYRYIAADDSTISTRIWSDPLHADGDGDGLSDRFEQNQLACPTCTPWADPDDPELFNPNVWNESPVALYVENNTNDDYVAVGETFVYTTTTTNNLSGGQRVVGDLALDLPNAFSGGPLEAQVDIQQGNSQSLVSQLTAESSQTAAHDLTSNMNVTNFDQTLWNWDAPNLTTADAVHGTVEDTAVARIPVSSGRLAMVTREVDNQGVAAIGYYQVWSDGSVESSRKLYVSESNEESLTTLDIDCNDNGVCLAVWAGSSSSQAHIVASRIEVGSPPSELSIWQSEIGSTAKVAAPAVATDGSRFMVAFGVADQDGTRLLAQRVNQGGNQPTEAGTITSLGGDLVGADVEWDGEAYLAVWADAGTLYRAAVDVNGQSSTAQTIAAGSGWPQADGTSQAPRLSFDDLSKQALLAYRSVLNGNNRLTARLLTVATDGSEFLIDDDIALNSEGVVVAASSDPRNSGWVLAWAIPGSGEENFRAIGPDGSLRGDVAGASQSSVTAVSLSCFLPQSLLRLQFEEPAGVMAFADSSGNDYTATCSAGRCPQSGIPGRFGNGVRFTAADEEQLSVSGGIESALENRSFTVAAWAKRDGQNARTAILSHGQTTAHKILVIGFDFFNRFTCDFGGGNSLITSESYTDTDWHHWACTYDSRTRTRRIYRDGIAVAQNTANVNYSGNGPLLIGNSNFSGYGFFNGLIDEVSVWQRPLSAEEMSDIASPVTAVYSLDEVPGATSFVDGTGNGYSASCSGNSCPTLGVPGKAFSAAQFDGVNDFIVLDPRPESTGQFFYDFESQTAPGWSSSDFYLGARNGQSTRFLGPFDNQNISLDLTNLPEHDTIEVSFDLFIAGEWAGLRRDIGPHNWEWGYDNQALLATNFSTQDDDTGNYQLFPDESWSFDPVRMTNTLGGLPGTKCPGATAGTYTQDTTGFLHRCADVTDRTVAFIYPFNGYQGAVWPVDPKRNIDDNLPFGAFARSVRIWPAANKPRHGAEPDLLAVSGYPLLSNAVFHVKATIPNHLADSIQLYFKGNNLTPGFQGQGWGLDNVLISTRKEGNTIPLADSSFTLSAWAKRSNTSQRPMIISQGRSAQNQGLQFGFLPSNTFTCTFWGNALSTSDSYTDTDWHHWACTYDATTKLRTIYRDGIEVAQDTASANYIGFGLTKIGTGLWDGTNFPGTIDEVSIWNSALTPDEIEQLYQNVKVDNQSILSCQLPSANDSSILTIGNLTLRETTTELGEINQSIVRGITIDNDRPSAEMTATYFNQNGMGGYFSSAGSLMIAGEAEDSTSYVAEVEVNAGSGWEAAEGSESWAYNWLTSGLSDGSQTLQLRATDAVGNVSQVSSWTAILDTTPPNISFSTTSGIVQPYRDALGRWLISLNGSVQDPLAGSRPGSGTTVVEVLLQGGTAVAGFGWQQAVIEDDGTWYIDYVLPEFDNANRSLVEPSGEFIVSARAVDAVNNITQPPDYPTMDITVDTVGPVVAPSLVLSDTEVINTAFMLEGSVMGTQPVTAVEVNLTPAQQIGALDGILLHLPFDERQATAYFSDQSGGANPATCGEGECPVINQPGQRDRSITLDGAADFLTVQELDLTDQSFTLAAWTKRAMLGDNNFIFSQGQEAINGALNFGYLETDQLRCGFWQNHVTTVQQFADGDWHHTVCTFDAASNTFRIYRDGVELIAETVTGSYGGNGPIYIGKRFDDSRFFNGSLDELIVYDRQLAAYEVANLYDYGLGTWEAATLDGDTWRYPISEGDDGLEGIYQINVRGIDTLGNVTPQSGQRVWRGEIDTRPPVVSFPVKTETIGEVTTTTYTCQATDFSLDGDYGCQVRGPAPDFRESDETFTTYDAVDPWYASVTTDSSRLFGIDAERTISSTIPNLNDLSLEVCDIFDHCTMVGPELLPGPAPQDNAEILSPSDHAVLTALESVIISGYAYDNNGLQALIVIINDEPVHAQVWPAGETTGSYWQFEWRPPEKGIYDFELLFSDWDNKNVFKSYMPLAAAYGPASRASAPESVDIVEGRSSKSDELMVEAITFLESTVWPQGGASINDVHLGSPATIYVDLAPPTDAIDPLVLTESQEIGIDSVMLTGMAGDDVQLHQVDVRVDDGDWQRAGLSGNGSWQLPWSLPTEVDGDTFEVSVRATDLAGRTTINTQTVLVDIKAPIPGAINLTYTNSAGQQVPVLPGETVTDAVDLAMSWAASSDGSSVVSYEVGFSSDSTPTPGDLTAYSAPGTHVQSVAGNQFWFATVQSVDGVGNRRTVTLGPIYVDLEP